MGGGGDRASACSSGGGRWNGAEINLLADDGGGDLLLEELDDLGNILRDESLAFTLEWAKDRAGLIELRNDLLLGGVVLKLLLSALNKPATDVTSDGTSDKLRGLQAS